MMSLTVFMHIYSFEENKQILYGQNIAQLQVAAQGCLGHKGIPTPSYEH